MNKQTQIVIHTTVEDLLIMRKSEAMKGNCKAMCKKLNEM